MRSRRTSSTELARTRTHADRLAQGRQEHRRDCARPCEDTQLAHAGCVWPDSRLLTHAGVKMVFLELRQRDETIQCLLAADASNVSKQMVKWTGSLPRETIVLVEGVVQAPKEPVKSTTVQDAEIKVSKVRCRSNGRGSPRSSTSSPKSRSASPSCSRTRNDPSSTTRTRLKASSTTVSSCLRAWTTAPSISGCVT